jgi:hypothetical protein
VRATKHPTWQETDGSTTAGPRYRHTECGGIVSLTVWYDSNGQPTLARTAGCDTCGRSWRRPNARFAWREVIPR